MATKMCEQCHTEKDLKLFRKVTNQYTGVHPMSICKECYTGNQEALRRKQAEEWEAGAAAREQRQRAREEWEAHEEQSRLLEQERLMHQQAIEAWDRQQPQRRCVDCQLELLASAFCPWISREEIEGTRPVYFRQRCNACHDTYRQQNRQVNPLCPICTTPTPAYEFLRDYRGYTLDIIKVCCERCIPRFFALPEAVQLTQLRRAMIKTYGDTAVIYALQYDEQFPCQHIGRTKRYERRMADYKRTWYKDIQRHFILQQLAFGPLSMEYESRWMLHALKYYWPIDNFERFKGGEDGLSGMRQQAELIVAVQAFEPLTAPFEVVGPLIREEFLGTTDVEIVNWYCSRYEPRARPDEKDMMQRLTLMERLYGLRL